MRTPRLFAVSALFLSFAWVLAGGCSSSESPAGPGGGHGNTGGTIGGTQGDPTIVKPDASGIDGAVMNDLNPLCGGPDVRTCLPDDASACRGYKPPVIGAGGANGGDGAGGAAGMSGAPAAQGGASGGAAGAEASAGGAANASGGAADASGGAGGEGGSPVESPPGLAPYGCQVVRQNNRVSRQCVVAGTGIENAPCFSAADCAPSFACVTTGDAGRCLPYCCDQNSTCTSGTYCAEQPLRKGSADAGTTDTQRVPVCVPADACSLDEQFPCPVGSECRCKGDTACIIVRDDGTTTCLKPGAGLQGDVCPCAWNHVCSSVTHQCIKICHTDPTKNDCGAQKCQASSELPQNFGVCVGPLE